MTPYKDPIIRAKKQKIYSRKHYEKNRETIIAKNVKTKQDLRKKLNNYKKTLKCEICNENRWYCLDFHHKDPNNKTYAVSNCICRHGFSWNRIMEEIEKCQILCRNCHAEIHHKERININEKKHYIKKNNFFDKYF